MTPSERFPLPVSSDPYCVEFTSGPIRLRLARAAGPLQDPPPAPVLIYRFTSAARRPGETFLLLAPGGPAPPTCDSSAELMAASCADWAPPAIDGRWRRDPGVRALAHELRRALVEAPRPTDPYLEHLVRAMLLRAQAVAAANDDAAGGGLSTPRLSRVMAAIDARFRERLTLDDLARTAGMSRARFAEAFRKTVGATPHAFIQAKRLEAVRAALDAGEQDLARLAARFGFSSHAHMTTAFRRAFGLTPSAYRRAVEDRSSVGTARPPDPRGVLRRPDASQGSPETRP